jgi:hypothetical protein
MKVRWREVLEREDRMEVVGDTPALGGPRVQIDSRLYASN